MKKIPLTQGKFALVDDEDFEWLNQWKWYYSKVGKDGIGGYAMRKFRVNGKQKTIRMHRLINNTPDGMDTDHDNGNKLDNRRKNLRDATTSQNQINRKKGRGNYSSRFKGVFWHKVTKKWHAQITLNGKRIHLGLFVSELAAAAAYDEAAIKFHGEFASLNVFN